MNKNANYYRAFTLVELLVVIAVIAILTSFLVPTVSSSRQKANAIKCMGQLREWGSAVSSFQGDRDGLFPAGSWYVELAPYVGLESIWLPGSTTKPRPGAKSLYSCPSASLAEFPANSTGKISYAMNNLIHVPGRNTGPIAVPTLRRSHLSKPSSFVVMFDAKTASAYGGTGDLLQRHGKSNIGNILFADGSITAITNNPNSSGKILLWDPVNAL